MDASNTDSPRATTASAHAAAYGCALASLPAMGPSRLRALVHTWGFQGAWQRVVSGAVLDHPVVAATLGQKASAVRSDWLRSAAAIDPHALLEAHHAAGITVTVFGSDRYPASLAADLDPPAVLFSMGDLDQLTGRRVGVVGTRRCTRSGRMTAMELGEQLARAGVRVVSGLALGIDGAAHQGALGIGTGNAPVVGVVGTGLDVPYPSRHQALWRAVAHRGVLISEVAMGGQPLAWRFPARNRIIAALSELVVVVESHASGGALLTVDEALRRDRLVMAVPGSVRSPASLGTNALLHAGASPARDAADVLTALGFASSGFQPGPIPDPIVSPDPADQLILSEIAGEPIGLDHLAASTGIGLTELALALVRLELDGWIVRSGSMVQRVRR